MLMIAVNYSVASAGWMFSLWKQETAVQKAKRLITRVVNLHDRADTILHRKGGGGADRDVVGYGPAPPTNILSSSLIMRYKTIKI